MKISIINGSPRGQGNCSFIVDRLSEKYSEDEVKVVSLNSIDFKGCQSCFECRKNNSLCVIDDDLKETLEYLLNSELIILLSPNYYGYVSGQMKLFLDRWYCLKTANRISKFNEGSKLFFILSQGAPNRDHSGRVVDWMKKFTESFNIKFYSYVVPGCNSEDNSISKLKYDDISMHLNMFI